MVSSPGVLLVTAEQERLCGEVECRGRGPPAAQGELGQLQGPPRAFRDGCRQRATVLEESVLAIGADLVDEAGCQGLLGVQSRPRVEHAAGDAKTDELREPPVRTSTSDDAQRRLRLGEHGPVRGDPEVAGQRQLAAASDGGAVDQRDGRPAVGLQSLEQTGVDREQRRVGVATAQLRDVGTRGEHARYGGVHDQDARPLASLSQHGVQRGDHLLVERVAAGRPVKADPPQTVFTADLDQRH
jgi:hypothetical protein